MYRVGTLDCLLIVFAGLVLLSYRFLSFILLLCTNFVEFVLHVLQCLSPLLSIGRIVVDSLHEHKKIYCKMRIGH
jgi:hypothetical protein